MLVSRCVVELFGTFRVFIGASIRNRLIRINGIVVMVMLRRMIGDHRAWNSGLCVTVDIEAHIDATRFLHHGILKH